MIKKRSRPQQRVRERSISHEEEVQNEEEGETTLPVSEILELRKLRKAREGIDVAKLHKGDVKKKKKRLVPEEEVGGLRQGAAVDAEDEDEEAIKEARTRRVVRANNFTQQTNVLDVDKHMMQYIEQNLKIRSRPQEDEPGKPADPQDELYEIVDRWKVEKQKPTTDEGSVTNSLTMLTAIPEVDLGMDARLKNIEETEKAKRVVAEERQERKKQPNGEEHLVASRFYRPNLKQKSDADIMRDAKLEAMGLPTQDDQPRRPQHDRPQMATDEMVMERFKKRMRK
ncbi:hypothetical protein CCMSSC00406_0001236 [Pleurotus cornucopiae]|uniref:Uncharacterized protein n=1 Tax=Pleurotus cornucopiae TaxID=5321 RepID=A0ACB7IL51_PLECO|nr:hypothetical protein CCMSSC00406_0001236 [Pleurotus cornucopiae]